MSSSAIAATCIAASLGLGLAIEPYAQLEDVAMVHLLGIVFCALFCSVPVSLLAAFVMVSTFDYFFVPPSFTFAQAEFKHALTFLVMIVVAAVVSSLQRRWRLQQRLTADAARRAHCLYELERELSAGGEVGERSQHAAATIERLLNATVRLALNAQMSPSISLSPTQQRAVERAIAERQRVTYEEAGVYWVWTALPGAGCFGALGVGVRPSTSRNGTWWELLDVCVSRLASFIEATTLATIARRLELEAETERARNTLLSAVSHDLKTPLASILAAATTLSGRLTELDRESAQELLAAVVSQTERLSRLVQNLLSATRLESRSIVLRRCPESLEDIVSAALEHSNARSLDCSVEVHMPRSLPLVCVDPTLVEQVFVNVIENAARYAGPEYPIQICAEAEPGQLRIQISDRGPGIGEQDRMRVFEKFYRGRSAPSADGGIGLGLTICRSIVKAHGGEIAIREAVGGGALVEFTLPIVKPLADEPEALTS